MQEFFNPAGLEIAEDRTGAVAYGFVAPRVLYARFVGELSCELGCAYVERLSRLAAKLPSLAYFADASALSCGDFGSRARFQRFVDEQRSRLLATVILTWSHGVRPALVRFPEVEGESIALLNDPAEFDRLLSNLIPTLPVRPFADLYRPLLAG